MTKDEEYSAMVTNLTSTQQRCTELLEEVRELRNTDKRTLVDALYAEKSRLNEDRRTLQEMVDKLKKENARLLHHIQSAECVLKLAK